MRPIGVPSLEEYYRESAGDYRVFWGSGRNLTMHYGLGNRFLLAHTRALERMNLYLALSARIGSQDVVIDLGCGLGGSSLWLAEHRGCSVIGIDVLPDHVRRARSAATHRRNGGNVRFLCRDYAATQLPSGTATVIWALESLVHCSNKHAAFAEAARILRPGGRLVMADYFWDRGSTSLQYEMAHWFKNWAIPDLWDMDLFCASASAAGFSGLTCTDITRAVWWSSLRMCLLATVGHEALKLLHVPSGRSPAQRANARGAREQFHALRKRFWRYMVCSAVRA